MVRDVRGSFELSAIERTFHAMTSTLPFKLNQDRRRHIPKQKHKLMNWRAYDASLRQRGSCPE
jgi:hypothetical protein